MQTGEGILIVWTDIPPEVEDDFNEWYNGEHLPDRVLRMPGFLRGRRYVSITPAVGAPKYLTYYDLQSAAVMQSGAHKALRKNRTARDQLFVPRFLNPIKGICDVAGRAGRGDGGYLVVLPLTTEAGREKTFAEQMCGELLPTLAAARGIVSAVFACRNAAITQASSAADDRAGDRYLDAVIAVETTGEAGAAAAVAALQPRNLARLGGGAHWIAAPCVLRLMVALAAPPVAATAT